MGDFDFLTGSWTVANRMLTTWLVGGDDWTEFPATARWEQAVSVDGEQTWETNWIMDLTRRTD